jgi:hypothetical protein
MPVPPASSLFPASLELSQFVFEGVGARFQEVHQHVHRAGFPIDGQFGPGDEMNAGGGGGPARLGNSIEVVVIGERDGRKADLNGFGNDLHRFIRAV